VENTIETLALEYDHDKTISDIDIRLLPHLDQLVNELKIEPQKSLLVDLRPCITVCRNENGRFSGRILDYDQFSAIMRQWYQ